MAIFHIIDHDGLGGVQTLLRDVFLDADFSELDARQEVYSLRHQYPKVGINTEYITVANSVHGWSPLSFFSFCKFLNSRESGVLCCHLFKSQVFGVLYKFFGKKNHRLIIYEHGRISESGLIGGYVYPFFLRLFKSKVDGVICVSNYTKTVFAHKTSFALNSIYVVYNCLSLEKYETLYRHNYGKTHTATHRIVIGYAARLIESKGWKLFLDAASKVKDYNNIKFLLAGSGPDEQEIIAYIRNNNLKNVDFVGFQSDMVAYYSLIDVLVLPSYYEGEAFPVTKIEAQAAGVALILANTPPMMECMTDELDCLFFESKDTESLVKSIIKISKDSDLRRNLIRNGSDNSKKFARSEYYKTISKITNELFK